MKEFEELKTKYRNRKFSMDTKFSEYGRLYHHTNENLKEYIPDLSGKKVLTVSASGDQILNIMGRGSLYIDTFDINRFSPLYQNLKLCAVGFLTLKDSYKFLNDLNKKNYYKFNNYLPNKERVCFDYIYMTIITKRICFIIFFTHNL